MPLTLIDATPYLGKDQLNEMTGYLMEKFRFAVQARSAQVDSDYTRWMDNYSARPAENVRTWPWYRASNFMPQLIRMHVDILTARMVGIIFGTKPFWRVSSVLDGIPRSVLEVLSTWLEFETSGQRMNFYPAIRSGIYRGFKTGTNVFKSLWMDGPTYGFSVATGLVEGKGVQSQLITKEGTSLQCVPFEDFFPFPLTVEDIDCVRVKFHRLRFTKQDLEWRRDQGLWNVANTEKLIQSGGEYKSTPAREAQASEAGIQLTKDVVMPFTAIEAWFDWTFPDKKRYKLVAVFNPHCDKAEDSLLRFYFNYDRRGEDPFIVQRPMPREDFFYGYSVPGILEQSQEEQAQIHNHRRDANTISNNPGWAKKRQADVPNPASEWYPGRVFELDDINDIQPLQFPGNYNSMIEEEQFLLSLADRYTGMGAPMQAMGSGILEGKRGVYSSQGTMAMLSAGSDRPDLYLKEFRETYHRLGRKVYRNTRDFGALDLPFDFWGESGQILQAIFQYPEPGSYDPVYFSIGASDAGANKEVDRTNLLLMANTMSSYYSQIVQMVNIVATMGPSDPRREAMLMVLDGAKDLADRLLFVFDIPNRKTLVPDVREILGGGPGATQQPRFDLEQEGVSPTESPLPLSGIQAISQRIAELPR